MPVCVLVKVPFISGEDDGNTVAASSAQEASVTADARFNVECVGMETRMGVGVYGSMSDISSGVGVDDGVSTHCVYSHSIWRKRQAVKPERTMFRWFVVWRCSRKLDSSGHFASCLYRSYVPDFDASTDQLVRNQRYKISLI